MASRGGVRPGAGRKVGAVSQASRDIAGMAKEHAEAALKTLVGIAQDAKAPSASRVAAAVAILDRGFGRPKQAIDLGGEVTVKTLADFYGAASKDS